ncbi:MAG TPA: cupredoxin domain-containing protein, partial [Myxococcaceae bacterium]
RLRITRTTDETCAKDLILPDYNIEKELPLNKAVDVEFTPSKAGKLKYGCSMGMMIAGVLIVE